MKNSALPVFLLCLFTSCLLPQVAKGQNLEEVKKQWIARGEQALANIEKLQAEAEALKPGQLKGSKTQAQIVLEAAFCNFIHPDFKDMVMKNDGKKLVCHLIFNSASGLTDLAYCYDETGQLLAFRVDSLAKEFKILLCANGALPDAIILFCPEFPNIDFTFDRTNPFSATVR